MLAFACQKKEAVGYQITAETIGFSDGTPVYVNTVNQGNRPVIIDSTTIQNNAFQIKLADPETNDFHFLTFKDVGGNVLYLGEKNPIQMTIYKDSLRASKVVGGSENKLFFEYLETMKSLMQERQKFVTKLQEARGNNDSTAVNQYTEKIASIEAEGKTYRTTMAKSNPNSLVSIMALTDLMNLKMLPAKKVKELYTVIGNSLKKSRLGENLNTMITNAIAVVGMGDTVEDFEAPTPEGDLLSLKNAMGKITIVDFWASWCKPCRIENPNVVRVYNKYHDKGLNIIGVSLDKSKDKWVTAIAQDKLKWKHISNLKFWQEPIAKIFGVRSIPATFILDEEGKIIARDLRGSQLEEKIKELLEKEAS